ncbi:hypothetical protein NliqN6_1413 [Naganishia liquefaciens]|uniref:Uncharacterized protein n=1 Tax=Naganishia liquefaciens TaxID=104408 RepID=A0A8H3TQC2_9TREE|nr:hypothetical protein NliqN6_1413 [Naganishia liquefaciens]
MLSLRFARLRSPCTRVLAPVRHYTTSRDPSHPHLYYHSLPSTTKPTLALSFLPDPPRRGVESRTVLGFLPANEEAGLEDFKENPPFRQLLHEAIKSALEAGAAPTVETEALTRGSDGFMHIGDARNPSPAGRIPTPHDIIGMIYVQDGKVMPETYEPQPMYRICTQDGVCILPYGLDEHVLKTLQAVADQE